MTTQTHPIMDTDALLEQSEILKIISSIRDRLDDLPKIREEIATLVKLQRSPLPVVAGKNERIANSSLKDERISTSENDFQQEDQINQNPSGYSERDSILEAQAESEQLAEPPVSSRPHGPEDEAKAKIEAQPSELDSCSSISANDKFILNRCWPEWIKSDSLAEWNETLYYAAADPSSPPSVGLLFAALHTSNAALCDTDPKTLHDSLRDVGRRLYAWLRDLEKSDIDAANIAEKWALVINAHCTGRAEVEVAVPGHEANNQWMIFQPRGGSSPDVVSVRTWCVRDAQKRPVHRAEVTV